MRNGRNSGAMPPIFTEREFDGLVDRIGATYEDLISIFLEHGAVNAANLDGGSSSSMIYQGEAMNINASVVGTRPLPTAFLVRK